MTLLAQLSGLRDHGGGRFTARCTAHEDESPSLSVQVDSDGTVLLHCFAGCTPVEVVNAVGMTLADLFPEPLDAPSRRPRRDYRALLELLGHEALVVLAAATKLRTEPLNDADFAELKDARLKVAGIVEAIRGR